jgi:hypothetical protein
MKTWTHDNVSLMKEWIKENKDVKLSWRDLNPELKSLFPDTTSSSIYHKWRHVRIEMGFPSVPGGSMLPPRKSGKQVSPPRFDIFSIINNAVSSFITSEVEKMAADKVSFLKEEIEIYKNEAREYAKMREYFENIKKPRH